MFIKVGSKFINLSEILFFEQIDNKEQGSFTIKLFFSDSLENCVLLESQEAQNFLNYLNELDDIYPTESSRQVEYYSNHNSTNHSKELSTIEESSDVPPPPILETLKKTNSIYKNANGTKFRNQALGCNKITRIYRKHSR